MKRILSVLAFAASASLAMAAFTPITSVTYNTVAGTPDQYNLTSLTTSNAFTGVQTTVTNTVLGFGATTTAGSGAPIAQMDDFNLNNLATGFSAEIRTVSFGGVNFTNVNGSLPDFFLFEASGSANPDDITIAAIFPDNSLGASVVCPTIVATNQWGNTGLVMGSGAQQSGQNICGLAWDITDLKGSVAGGSTNLSSTTIIKGIAIVGGFGIDPCAFLATAPPVLVDHFAVTTSVASTNVGDVFNVTITAQDAGNVTVNSGGTVVTVSASGSLMEFDWNSDGTYGDNSGTLVAGVKTIKARNKKAETATIVAAAGAATTPTPPSVTTTALAFSKLLVLAPGETGAPGTATGKAGAVLPHLVGEGFSVTVNAVDLYWNFIASAPADNINITTTDNTATLPADALLAAGTQIFSLTNNQRGSFTITATNTSNGLITNGVSASITAGLALVWKGDGSTNLWNTTALNWTNIISGVINYANGDPVTFDDSGSTTPAVNIVGTVSPLSFTINSANSYTFTSTNGGGIGGTAGLTKTGAGSLTLNTSNSYAGGTRFADGSLILSNAFALPTAGTLALTNSTVVLAGTNLTRASAVIGGTNVGFAAVGANRSVNIGNIGWGGGNFFTGSGDYELVLGRASASFTLDLQSQIDFLSNGGDKIIRVDNGAAAVDAVISGRIQDNSGNTGRLVKTGAGTLQLSHPTSNYEIPTLIQDGIVILTGGHANNGSIILGDGATSGVLQLGDASATNSLSVNSITTSGSGTANRVVGGNASVSTLTLNTTAGSVTFDGVLGGPGVNQNNLALTKNQSFLSLTLTASNTYTGPTIINSGNLILTGAGSINNSVSIDVTSGDTFDVSGVTGGYALGAAQTLKGSGTVNGDVTANGRITPGSSGIGTLTFGNNLTLNGSATIVMEINATNAPNSDQIATLGTFTPGGSLTVTNIRSTVSLAASNTFQLFNSAVVGSFSSIQLPPTPAGWVWATNLAVDGSIATVAASAPTPTNITVSVSGGNLILNWPAGQGWNLQAQTNTLATGLKTNWVTVPGAVPPFTNAMNPANGSVFYRLTYP